MTRTDLRKGMVCGWVCGTRKALCLEWENGRFTRVAEPTKPPPPNQWIAPTLVDLQINGYAGVDFQNDRVTERDLVAAVQALRRAACGQFLVTLVSDEWERMLGRLERLRRFRAQSPLLQSAIVGWHLEGPFLSDKPGFAGAHNPAAMRDPELQDIHQLKALAGDDPVLLTVAPERNGAVEAIALAKSMGMKISLGHTDASLEQLRAAVVAGATGFTHLANACPQELDRHDNIVWRVLDTPGLMVSLIPDQIHVSPLLFRLVHRVLPWEAIYYTTDAVAPAGAPPGRYQVGRFEVEVGPDQVVRQPGKTNYAGSALQPIGAVVRAAKMLGRNWQETWKFLAEQPRKLMGWSQKFALGQPVSFCTLELDENGNPEAVQTVIGGEET